VLLARKSNSPARGSTSPPGIRFDLGSANGERRPEPPHREGSRLPAALRAGRREFHEALLEAGAFEDLPGKWQAAILKAGQSRPTLRFVSDD
jgi:hypothetical protein